MVGEIYWDDNALDVRRAFLVFMKGDNGTSGRPNQFFSNRAEKETAHPTKTVCTHYNEVNAIFGGIFRKGWSGMNMTLNEAIRERKNFVSWFFYVFQFVHQFVVIGHFTIQIHMHQMHLLCVERMCDF